MEMKIRTEVKTIDELMPAEYNPRKALKKGDPEYERLKKSIKTFGYVDPVIWNETTGYVVGGHQRLTVLKDLGYKEITVSVVNLDLEKEKQLNIALNKISGDWDQETLFKLLEELNENDGLELTGFTDDEFEKLKNKFSDEEEEEQEPEFKFTEELLEEHNYVVLYFDNKMDWQTAVEKLGIESVHALDSREGYERKGIGRVIRGDKVLERLQ